MNSCPKPELRLDWCSHAAAKYAVEHWHYSRSMPPPPHNRVGVWEHGIFIGVVLFARGANNNMLRPFGLLATEGCELVRVALKSHDSAVSKIISIALRFLRLANPGLRLVVSFADPEQGHVGVIYQAGGWLYCGRSGESIEYIAPDGKRWHGRMVSASGRKRVYGLTRAVWRRDQCEAIRVKGKHRYLYPLDAEMRARILPLARPYPKRPKEQAPEDHSGLGGATPTRTLHSTETPA